MLRETSNLRAWYIEDLARLLEAIRLSSVGLNDDERRGFDLALASIGVAIGLNMQGEKWKNQNDLTT